MTDNTEAPDWPEELWAAQIKHDEYEMTGTYVLSVHATVPRWEGDKERDRPWQRYVDEDIVNSLKKYHRHQVSAKDERITKLEDERDALKEEVERLKMALAAIGGDAAGRLWAFDEEKDDQIFDKIQAALEEHE